MARVGDDERMQELKRRVASGKAFGNRVEMITPAQAKAKFPLLEESMIQGALWDPDAGLVKPRSQMVAGELVDAAVASGKLRSIANTACTGLRIDKRPYPGRGDHQGLYRRRPCGGVRRFVGAPDCGDGR